MSDAVLQHSTADETPGTADETPECPLLAAAVQAEEPSCKKSDSSLAAFSGKWKSTTTSATATIQGDSVILYDAEDVMTVVEFMVPGDGSCCMGKDQEKTVGKLSEDGLRIEWGDDDIWLRVPLLAMGQEVKFVMTGVLFEKRASDSTWLVKLGLGDGDVFVSIKEAQLEQVSQEEALQLRHDSPISTSSPSVAEAASLPSAAEAAKTAATQVAAIAAAASKVMAAQAAARAADAKKVVSVGAAAAEKGTAQAAARAADAKKAVTAGAAAAEKGAQKVQNWLRKRFAGNRSEELPPVSAVRRRLCMGHVPDVDDDEGSDVISGEYQDLLVSLTQQNLSDVVVSDDVALISSVPDLSRTSFKSKTLQEIGKRLDPAEAGLGYTCRKGLKPESLNQDSFFVIRVDGDFSMYGVIDGSGQKGHDVAAFVREYLPKLIIQDPRFKHKPRTDLPSVCIDAFTKMQRLLEVASQQRNISAELSGCGASIVIHDHLQQKLTVAHVANSIVCIVRRDGSRKTCIQLTRAHEPDLQDERQRIERAGGRVVFDGYANHRVYVKHGRYPGLTVSRCLGHLLGHADAGLICTPEVSEHPLSEDDLTILLCSDGVSEFVTPSEVLSVIEIFPPDQLQEAANKVAKESWDRWIQEEGGAVTDDITVVLADLAYVRRILTCDGTILDNGSIQVSCRGMDGSVACSVNCDAESDVDQLQASVAALLGVGAGSSSLVNSDGKILEIGEKVRIVLTCGSEPASAPTTTESACVFDTGASTASESAGVSEAAEGAPTMTELAGASATIESAGVSEPAEDVPTTTESAGVLDACAPKTIAPSSSEFVGASTTSESEGVSEPAHGSGSDGGGTSVEAP